jgi:hypothetical protein
MGGIKKLLETTTLRYWGVFNMLSSAEDSKVRQWEKLYKALS